MKVNPNCKIVLVLSGKGGVGKSTVSTQLALGWKKKGLKVGLLDADLCGPSIPHMLGISDHDIYQNESGWDPVYTDDTKGLGVMSIGFLLSRSNESVVWRGPKKNSMIKKFVQDVTWGDREIIIIDTPPGTSDEHISLLECLRSSNLIGNTVGVLVTTPQIVSVNDVIREYDFCLKTKLKVAGIIENMSGYVCPNCSECTNIFSKGGGQELASKTYCPFLGAIPIEPKLASAADSGDNFIQKFEDSEVASILESIISKIEF
ncbi:cytosolic Fe-S cluster assembly factor NUBP2 [Lepeophtheirus salmonis]|uniref:Nucleotide binding protein 2 [Melopsittacus undulatus] n=1 Tax=Lepeophtheirus salmonis TaxID=72036 RepID=A0A0K2UMR2_LEPSM|nr:cytosolic Fe-S cluster assembly factor NUBP2-like [Lepeophtheirus salmonis]